MTSRETPRGMTLQIQVGDIEQARRFYGALFGSPPQYEPHEDFLEWRVVDGAETWVQVVSVTGAVRPLLNRVRFEVGDVKAAREVVQADGFDVSAVTVLPGVVRYIDFSDPWGNQLGYYEDLAAGGEPPIVGGSVHDESHFVVQE